METNQEKIAVYKLVILYILQQTDMPLSENRLSEMSASLNLMEYFQLKTSLYDLLKNHLIAETEQINGKFFHITDSGRTTLSFFETDLLFSLRQKINHYLQTHQQDILLEKTIYAEYIRLSDHQYRIVLRILENELPVFELSFFAQSAAEAEKYIFSWKSRAYDVYRSTFETLLAK